MRTGAAAGHRGYFHEAIFYSSDDDLLAVAVPFLTEGMVAGEPTVVALTEKNTATVRAALPAADGLTFLADDDVYARPAAAIRSYRAMMTSYVARGAGQIRILGEVPTAALGVTWDSWARYESAINRVYDDFPLWSLCAYDTRITPAAALADVARTHPRSATTDGRHLRSDAYADPLAYLSEDRMVPPDPLELTVPAVELTDPLPLAARRAVRAVDHGRLTLAEVEDLVVAVSEVVTNAIWHGRPPVVVRIWPATDRTVVTVTDGGAGPKDPFAGLVPASAVSSGGRGLWITHLSCNHVTASRTGDSFTVRLTAGNPHFAV
jgi:anti-sigma regulatory factor (Ser/Thr protein kinase)